MIQECTLAIDNIHCASCIQKIEHQLSTLAGISSASVNFASSHALIAYDPEKIALSQLLSSLSQIGYPAHLVTFQEEKEPKERGWDLLVSALCSVPLVLHMVGLPLSPLWQLFLASLVQLIGGYPFYRGTWQGLKSFSSNMDTLVALGTTAAYGFSLYTVLAQAPYPLYFETSALLITFILLGRWLEKRAKRQANSGMRALLALQPKTARMKKGDEYHEVPIDTLPLGAIFAIRPGERVPADGVVEAGISSVDESMLTGESFPVPKQQGSPLYAGTINKEGLLEATVTRIGKETALGAIIRLVEKAQSSKAPIQRLADRITAVFVPIVLLLSLLTLFLWIFLAGNPTQGWVNAVAVLVIACPCALGLATPTVILVACGRAAKQGILIKDAAVLEMAQKISVVLLDKTGTATEGKLEVVKSDISSPEFDSYIRSLAQHSDHPASQAIAASLSSSVVPVENLTAHPGKGISGKIEKTTYFLGSPSWIPSSLDASSLNREEGMVVAFFTADKLLGHFVLADRLRQDAKEAIAALHSLQISVYLLTGDRTSVASQIAQSLSVDGFEAEILPSDKTRVVQTYQSEGKITAMVGDGINDAPALAAADIGFAIGSGTDVALESASVILIQPSLYGVIETIALAKQTFAKIRQNLFFAFAYNLLGVPLAALGFLSPLIAGIAMALSSLSVVSNALLLQRKRSGK